MPSISEILDSVSVPSLIRDRVIKNGYFEKSGRGIIYYSGGFTVVLPVNVNGKRWAFRCWHTEMGNVRKRFQIISHYINNFDSTYFCKFFYCDSGLVVDGKVYPTTRMDWVDGETINQYIINNASNKELLLSLADKFLKMIQYLHKYHIAHGDLQHGNIIIDATGEIKLVDYDSLFVPGLEGELDLITGKAEYQHPKRKQAKIISEKLDYFSELVIYLSIIAVAYNPSIIQKFSIDDSLLFQADDWIDFENRPIYEALKNIGIDDISILVDILADYLKEDNIYNLKVFTDLWKILIKEPVIHSFICGNIDGIVYRDMETSITWDAENIGKLSLNSIDLPCDQTNYKMIFSEDTDISLVIRNGIHVVEQIKHIKVVDVPTVHFFADKYKLKNTQNGIESCKLRWSVSNGSSVILKCGDKSLSTKINNGEFEVHPSTDSVYELIVIGLDKKTEFKSTVTVLVRKPANVSFSSDKLFTFPGVPITISWDIKGGKNVCLNGKNVGLKGNAVFTPDKDEQYKLSYEDDFGIYSSKLTVRMLPLPYIKSILVDTPNINKTVSIKYTTPQFHGIPDLPSVEAAYVNINMPDIPDLNNSGIFVSSPDIPKETLTEKISRFLKNVFR